MNESRNLNGLVLVDKQKLGEILDDFKANIEPLPPRGYECNICGDEYPESELRLDPEVGCICDGCADAKKELDDEQMEIERAMRRSG